MNEKEFEQLLKITINNAVKKELGEVVQDVKQIMSQPQPVKVEEIAKTPNWIEENIDTIADLGTFETEESMLKAWREARKIKKAKNEQKSVMEALEIIAAAGFVTETREQTIRALEAYEDKIRSDLLTQVKRNFSNPEKIEDELFRLLQPYALKFNIIRKALHILQSFKMTIQKDKLPV